MQQIKFLKQGVSMEQGLLYHGSREIVKFPEIRQAKYNKDF